MFSYFFCWLQKICDGVQHASTVRDISELALWNYYYEGIFDESLFVLDTSSFVFYDGLSGSVQLHYQEISPMSVIYKETYPVLELFLPDVYSVSCFKGLDIEWHQNQIQTSM